jgi:hypothetical protein
MKLLKDQRAFLRLFMKTSSLQRKALLRSISADQIKVLCEIIHNILTGTIKLTSTQKTSLTKHKALLRLLGDKRTKPARAKRALQRAANVIVAILIVVEPILKTIWK